MSSAEGALVLGMHRSGTSAATRLLNLAGLATCREDDLFNATGGNAKGHWESTTLFRLNDRLLGEMGRSWWCPQPADPVGQEAALARLQTEPSAARAAFDQVHPTRPWVWKDPRTATLLPFWRRALDEPIVGVVAVRHPLEVAASLRTRHGWSLPLCLALWERSTRLLLDGAAGLRLLVATYDVLVGEPLRWYDEAVAFLRESGLDLAPAGAAEVTAFVDPELRHEAPGGSLPPDVAQTYAALLATVGVHEAFEPPRLVPEPGWVEATLVSYAASQRVPLPRPVPVTTSVVGGVGPLPAWAEGVDSADPLRARGAVIVRSLADDPADGIDRQAVMRRSARMDAGGRPTSVVLLGDGPALAETCRRLLAGLGADGEVLLAGASPLRDRRVRGGVDPLGAATHDVVVFVRLGIELGDGWRAAIGRSVVGLLTGAVGPVAADADDRASWSGGEQLSGPMLARRQLAAPTAPTPVPLPAPGLLAVRADVLRRVGGLDPAYADADVQLLDLCLRIQRAGLDIVTDPALRVVVPAEPVRPRPLADHIRLATVHLGADDLQASMRAWRRHPQVAAATAAVALSDAASRRAGQVGESPEVRPAVATGHRHVWVGGVHQSGANVLTWLLGLHPDASSFDGTGKPDDEGQHLQEVLPTAAAYGGPGRFALEPAAHLTENSPQATSQVAARLLEAWRPHWDLRRRLLVEQSPQNMLRCRLFRALFPDSYAVVVTRHPVAVALATQEWLPALTVEDLVEHWLAAWETFTSDAAGLDRVRVVAYEDLVLDPVTTLTAVGDHLGLPGLEAYADFVEAGVHRAAVERWATVTAQDPTLPMRLRQRYGSRVARAGYDVTELSGTARAGAQPGTTS